MAGSAESERAQTILLVEDEQITRSFIQRFLERDGHHVIAVDAAEEGIVEASESPPDVLISDIHLPGLSGIELASFLLAQDPRLAVILMSGDPDEELARRAMATGPVQYLLKPFEWFELQAAVRFALRQREMSAASAPADRVAMDAAEFAEACGAEDLVLELVDEAVVPPVGEWPEDSIPPGAWVDAADPGAGDARENVDRPDEWLVLEQREVVEAGVDVDRPGEWLTLVQRESLEASLEPGAMEEWLEPEPSAPAEMLAFSEPAAEVEEVAPPEEWLERVDRESFAGPGHGDRVARIALALLDEMPEPAVQASDLALAGRVHEVGRLQLPGADPVDVARRGAEVLAETGFPPAVTEAIRHMHERWDGAAGPEGLSGTRIPAGARILAVADALDHYVSAWIRSGVDPTPSVERAMHLVTVQQSRAFGPGVVAAMHRASAPLLRICAQDRPPPNVEPVPTPALAAAQSVPFALFAWE